MMRPCLTALLYLAVLVAGCPRKQVPQPDSATFDVVMTAVGQNEVQAIKSVREVTGLGLREAKGLVERTPVTVKESLPLEEAEEMARKLREADLTIDVRSH